MTMESKIIKILNKIKEDLDVNNIRTSNDWLLDLGITSLTLIFLIVEIEKDIQLIAKIFMARSVGGCDFSVQRRRSA